MQDICLAMRAKLVIRFVAFIVSQPARLPTRISLEERDPPAVGGFNAPEIFDRAVADPVEAEGTLLH
jgi:hypothetical protein